jgi:hypothetical protein
MAWDASALPAYACHSGIDVTAEVHWVALLPPGSGVKEEAKPAGCPG